MKIFLIGLICVLTTSHKGYSQYDSSFQNSYYEQKTSQFEVLRKRKSDILFVGNSLNDTAEWTEIWDDLRVKNRGISADNTFGVLARLGQMLEGAPAKIFLMIGINDLARGIPVEVIERNYEMILARISKDAPGTQVYVQSVLPTSIDFPELKGYQDKHEHIKRLNHSLRALSLDFNYIYVDLHSVFLDAKGQLSSKYTTDGLHLNMDGYLLWKSILEDKEYCCI